MPLHQLIYQSRETHKYTSHDFVELLEVSRRNNDNLNITGCLFYNGGWIVQVLEGEKHVIENLYEKITQDTRHKDCNLMQSIPIEKRVFSKWSMGMINLDTDKDSKYRELKAAMDDYQDGKVAIPLPIKLLRIFSQDYQSSTL
ncbi:hypothetical protein PULV_b0228 [Pseudoalteromonas ulvae UL12]|uniref:BLUF domain-containing protein n=1 Tax=Pseudoalteromonas ulvae TaxID=107327 RepID=UPI00186B74BD|nr:BLUF domain-containing protein [Pseudoalteromonas ulvae]MBE0365616.1 hypothetical protein [Pseudoalteromonas ulvae UL12]